MAKNLVAVGDVKCCVGEGEPVSVAVSEFESGTHADPFGRVPDKCQGVLFDVYADDMTIWTDDLGHV